MIYKRIFLTAGLSLLVSASTLAQDPPAPTVAALEPGATTIQVTLAEPPGDKPAKVKTQKNEEKLELGESLDGANLNRETGVFTATLTAALAAGDSVRARVEIDGSASEFSDAVIVAAPPEDDTEESELIITSIVATAGSKTVTVHFNPLPEDTETAKLLVQASGQIKTMELGDEIRTSGAAEIEMDYAFAPSGNAESPGPPNNACPIIGLEDDDIVQVKLTAESETVTFAPSGGVCSSSRIHVPKLSLVPQSIREGESHVNVDGATQGTIRVLVYRGVLENSGQSPSTPNTLSGIQNEYKMLLALAQQSETAVGNDAQQPVSRETIERRIGRVTRLRLESLNLRQSVDKPAGATRDDLKVDDNLNAGDWVMACLVVDTGRGQVLVGGSCSTPKQAASVLLDWGRVRGVFSFGTSIDPDGEQSAYLDFVLNNRVFGKLLDKNYFCPPAPLTDNQKSRQANNKMVTPARKDCEWLTPVSLGIVLSNSRKELYTFFNARVTNFDVASNGSANGTDSGSDPQAVLSREFSTTPVNSALVQFGGYWAIGTKGMDWIHQGNQYSFFFGPMVKSGIQTVSDGAIIQREIVSTSTLTRILPSGVTGEMCTIDPTKCSMTTALTTTTNDTVRKGVQPFWAAGTRLGFFKYDLMGRGLRNRQVSSDLVSYLDIAVGKFNAFRTYDSPVLISEAQKGTTTTMLEASTGVSTETTPTSSTSRISSQMNWRMNIEGRVKVPYVPAFVGFDANFRVGDGDQVPNDLRFLVGFRVDANKVLGVFNREARN